MEVSFSTFPNEIVEKLLKFLSTKKLLKCRLVCQNWNLAASSICRKRFLPLKHDLVDYHWKELNEVFGRCQNVPWSSMQVNGMKESDGRLLYHPERTLTFFSRYGIHVRELIILAFNHINCIKKLLKYLPNLEKLRATVQKHFDYEPEEEWAEDSHGHGDISLRMLKTAEIIDSGIGALELLAIAVGTNSRNGLTRLTFQFVPTSREYADEVTSLLAHIPYVKLEIFSDCPYFTKNVRIQSLQLTDSREVSRNYGPLESFLAMISEHLKTLKICCLGEHAVESHLRIPVLPNLENLNLDSTKDRGDDGIPPRAFTFLRPLSPHQFPGLRTLEVNGGFSSASFIGVFNPTTPFASVRSFWVSDWDMAYDLRVDWFQLLPNLTRFTGTVSHANFTQIWRNMSKLERLTVTVKTTHDVTAVLLDILDPSAVGQLLLDRTQVTSPFVNMPGLRRFSFRFSGDLKEVTDHGVSLSLLLLHPLKYLSLSNVNISEQSMENLRRHHKQVRFKIY